MVTTYLISDLIDGNPTNRALILILFVLFSSLMERPSHECAANIPILRYQNVYTIPITAESSTASPLLRALALSPDGRYLGGAFDRYVTIWRLKENQEVDEDKPEQWTEILKYRIDERSISEEITCLSWMTTGHILIGSNIGDVKIVKVNADVCNPRPLYLFIFSK